MNSQFRLDPSITAESIRATGSATEASVTHCFTNVLDFKSPPHDVSTFTGDYEKDLHSGKFNKSWGSLPAMQAWILAEEDVVVMDLRLKMRQEHVAGEQGAWMHRYYYNCARQGTGGLSKYVKKNPEWNQKNGSRQTGCVCQLLVKSYPNTPTLLGQYVSEHSHPIGEANARYTMLSKPTRIKIAESLCKGVTSERVVCHISLIDRYSADSLYQLSDVQGGVYDSRNVDEVYKRVTRDRFATLTDVRRIQVH